MARCSTCMGEFEGARQPNCPLCGASRPRPHIPMPEKPPDLAATVVALNVRAEAERQRKDKKRRRRERAVPSDPLGQRLAPIAAVPAQDEAQRAAQPRPIESPKPPGPPPIEVEYIFGGAERDVITLVTTIDVLDKAEESEPEGPQHDALHEIGEAGKRALGRAKSAFRRG